MPAVWSRTRRTVHVTFNSEPPQLWNWNTLASSCESTRPNLTEPVPVELRYWFRVAPALLIAMLPRKVVQPGSASRSCRFGGTTMAEPDGAHASVDRAVRAEKAETSMIVGRGGAEECRRVLTAIALLYSLYTASYNCRNWPQETHSGCQHVLRGQSDGWKAAQQNIVCDAGQRPVSKKKVSVNL